MMQSKQIPLQGSEGSCTPQLGSWQWCVKTDDMQWSTEVFQIFGRNSELGPVPWQEYGLLFLDDSLAQLRAASQKCLEAGDGYQLSLDARRLDGGKLFSVVVQGAASREKNGQTEYLFGSIIKSPRGMETITHHGAAETWTADQWFREREFSRLVIENIAAGVVVCDDCGNLIAFNRVARAWHGVDPSSIPQSEWANFYDLRDPTSGLHMPTDQIPLVRAFRGERVENQELLIASNGQPLRHVVCNGSQLLDPDGRCLGAAVVMNDITDRIMAAAALASSEHRLRSLLQVVPVAIGILDQDRRMVMQNEMYFKTLGYALEETPDFETWMQRVFPDPEYRLKASERWHTAVQRAKDCSGVIEPDEFEIVTRCGTMRIMEITGCPLDDGVIFCLLDVTERRAAEKSSRLAMHLAEEANHAKSSFLAAMSHEIRTPLNGILGFASLLAESDLNPEQSESCEIIRSSSELLLMLINDILDFSKIEAGRVDLELMEFELAPAVNGCVDLIRPTAMLKGLSVSITIAEDVPATIAGDVTRIRQILTNLLSNAVKFTDHGGIDVQVTMAPDAQMFPSVRFAISDTGIGLTPDQCKTIFEPFTQADASIRRRFGGTGLGLSICLSLARVMNGTIHVTSMPGQGSEFTFELPLASPLDHNRMEISDDGMALSATIQSTVSNLAPSGLQVLVVDDHEMSRKVLVQMLRSLGCQSDVAQDGEEAVDLALNRPYDMVLMDLQMPKLDGWGASRMIRSKIQGDSRPYIAAVTAMVSKADKEKCHDAGMDEFIAKPICIEMIKSLLHRMISNREPTKF